MRVALRTRVAPRYYDKDGVAENLIGQERHVVGVVEEFTFDRLLDALRACVATCPLDAQGERLALSDNGDTLQVRTHDENLSLHTPLFSLHKHLERPLLHRRSIIHGDLHTRNVIVSPGGMPYYIDFSDTGIGPTLFDFIKHEAYLWCWSLAGVPDGEGRPECTLTEAVRLMRALTHRKHRFPAALTLPDFLSGDRHGWQAKFYRCVGTVRSLARDHRASPGRGGAGLLPAPGRVHRPDAPLVPPQPHRVPPEESGVRAAGGVPDAAGRPDAQRRGRDHGRLRL